MRNDEIKRSYRNKKRTDRTNQTLLKSYFNHMKKNAISKEKIVKKKFILISLLFTFIFFNFILPFQNIPLEH